MPSKRFQSFFTSNPVLNAVTPSSNRCWLAGITDRWGPPSQFVGLLVGLWLVAPATVEAHGDATVTPDTVWTAWNGDVSLLLGLALAAGLYARGVVRLWRRAGVGQGVRRWQVAAFAGGVAALVFALVSPLESLASVLFSAHMVQHLILILCAAPLLVLGVPGYVWLWGLPQHWRTTIGRWWKRSTRVRALWHGLSHPLFAWGFYAATLWLWHTPPLFDAALHSSLVHELEHLSFLFAAIVYCWVLINPMGPRRLSRGVGILYLFTTSVHGSLLSMLITFAPRPWYEHYTDTTEVWGLAPLQDQQLGGLIMWIPAGMVYAGLAAVLLILWIKDIETEMQRAEPHSTTHRSPTYPMEILDK